MEPDWLEVLRAPDRAAPWVVLEGRPAVEAALAGWGEVAGVVIERDHPWEVPVWSGLEVHRTTSDGMVGMGCAERHRGVIGLARMPAETGEVAAFAKTLPGDALLLVVPRLSEPGQAGGLVRLALELGVAGLLFGAEGLSPFDPGLVEASGGAVFRLPVRVADGGQLLRSLKAAGVDLSGWEEGASAISGAPASGRRALVVGDGAAGLGPFWRALCDRHGGGDRETVFRSMALACG